MKIKQLLSALFCIVLFLSACSDIGSESTITDTPAETEAAAVESAEADAESASLFPYTFTDSLGNEVTVDAPVKKAAVLFSSLADIWNACGGEIAVTVGDSVERGFAEADAILVNDGAGLKIDTEALVAAEPDLVIGTASFSAQQEAAETLREMGIPCALFDEDSFEDYLQILKIFADLNENETAYQEQGMDVEAEIDTILDDLDKKEFSYLFIRAGSGFSATKAKTAEDHFACVILDVIGGHNIAEEAGNLAEELSLESILAQDPDYIILAAQGDEDTAKAYIDELFAEDGWSELTAIRENRCFFVDKELYNYKPNSRWAEAYQTMIELIYE